MEIPFFFFFKLCTKSSHSRLGPGFGYEWAKKAKLWDSDYTSRDNTSQHETMTLLGFVHCTGYFENFKKNLMCVKKKKKDNFKFNRINQINLKRFIKDSDRIRISKEG